jgi:hypothetical protein
MMYYTIASSPISGAVPRRTAVGPAGELAVEMEPKACAGMEERGESGNGNEGHELRLGSHSCTFACVSS